MSKFDRLLIIILILALIAGLFSLGQRFLADREHKTVQIAMDYRDLYARQDLWQVPLPVYLSELKENGLRAVVLRENTVEEMVERGLISAISGSRLLEMRRAGGFLPSELNDIHHQSTYIFSDDLSVLVRLQAELVRKLGEQRVHALAQSSPWVIEVQMMPDSLMGQRIGFLLEDLEMIAASGLDILPVLYNYGRIEAGRFEEILQELEQYGRVHSVLFDGPAVTGFYTHLERTALSMNYRNLIMGMIQPADTLLGHVPVAGTVELLERIHYRGARTYMVSRGITNNITTAGMINRWLTSVREYNIHILYLRPFHSGSQGETVAQRNLTYIDGLTEQLFAAGYRTGAAPSYPDMNDPHPLVWFLLMAGVGAAAVILMTRHLKIKPWIQGLLLGGAISSALMTALVPRLAVLQWAWALGGAVLFPVLALSYLLQADALVRSEKNDISWWQPLRFWAGTTLVTICGSIIVAAIITNNRFILDVEYFRGVKVSYIIPLGLTALLYYWYSVFSKERNGRILPEIKELAGRSLTMRDLTILVSITGLLAFYILRSGNVEISTLELTAREWLDRVLIVRPRTKEFLVGHPFLILAIAAGLRGHRKFLIVLFTLGAIGQISIMNTFMHIRTPLLESLLRTGNGIWLGALMGLLYVLIWDWIQGWAGWRDGQKPNNQDHHLN